MRICTLKSSRVSGTNDESFEAKRSTLPCRTLELVSGWVTVRIATSCDGFELFHCRSRPLRVQVLRRERTGSHHCACCRKSLIYHQHGSASHFCGRERRYGIGVLTRAPQQHSAALPFAHLEAATLSSCSYEAISAGFEPLVCILSILISVCAVLVVHCY